MRRIVAVLSVMVIMAALFAASAVPAFAQGGGATVFKCSEFDPSLKGNVVITPSGNFNYHCRLV